MKLKLKGQMQNYPHLIVFSDTQVFRKLLGMYRALCIEATLSPDEIFEFSSLLITANTSLPALNGLAHIYRELGQKLEQAKRMKDEYKENYSLLALAVLLSSDRISDNEKEYSYQTVLKAIKYLDHPKGIPISEINKSFTKTLLVESREELFSIGAQKGMTKDEINIFLQSF